MQALDLSGGFDLHAHREGFKLLKQDRETLALANRAPFACPACEDEFDRLFVTEKPRNSFGPPGGPFCIVRTEDQILLLTH